MSAGTPQTGSPEERLARLGIALPPAPAPAAAYVPYVVSGTLVFTAGQLPVREGELTARGKLGDGVGFDEGIAAARQCAINVLSQVKAALGDLDRVRRLVKITVFVASAPAFTDQHLVANGASELLAEVLGDGGSHARSAVGVVSLPMDAPVEVEAVVEQGA